MGLCSEVLAIGPFSRDIVHCLDYCGDRVNENTKDGAIVTVHLFGVDEGEASRKFASCFGISDPSDFNQHKIRVEAIDVRALYDLFDGDDWNVESVDALVELMAKGFEFHFLPKGLSRLE